MLQDKDEESVAGVTDSVTDHCVDEIEMHRPRNFQVADESAGLQSCIEARRSKGRIVIISDEAGYSATVCSSKRPLTAAEKQRRYRE
nr:unnamed protein product [Callosobruchus analis]